MVQDRRWIALNETISLIANRFNLSEALAIEEVEAALWSGRLGMRWLDQAGATHDLSPDALQKLKDPQFDIQAGTLLEKMKNEAELRAMQNDPRYWNPSKRDTALVDEVEVGFKRLYPGQENVDRSSTSERERPKPQTEKTHFPIGMVEINRHQLLAFVEKRHENYKQVRGGKRGPAPRQEWEDAIIELGYHWFKEDFHAIQADAEEFMMDWFIQKYGEHPSESTIRERVSKMWKRYGLKK
jgi:hypothetical protein